MGTKCLLCVVFLLEFVFIINCFPIPGQQVVKYRVSNKFFNTPNSNENSKQNSNALYNLLSQIHYGGISQPNVIPIDTNKIQTEDISPMIVNENIIGGSAKVPDIVVVVTPEVSVFFLLLFSHIPSQ